MTLELNTEDKLEYAYHPLTTGCLNFKVRAANDAHLALSSEPNENGCVYEIFIGGWGNSKTAIRRNRQKPDKAVAETPNILNGGEYRGFWVRWADGSIAIGKEGEAAPFVAWDDPEPFPVAYFGVCTGWGATGSWLIENGAEITTSDRLEYSFRPVPSGQLEIDVRSPSNAHIALTSGPRDTEPMYEILLGGWENSASVIRHNRQKPDKVRAETPGLLTSSEFKHFTVVWRHGLLQVKKDGNVLLEWQDPNPFGISHYGIRTAWGARGHWRVKSGIPTQDTPSAPLGWNLNLGGGGGGGGGGGAASWVDSVGGQIPPNAVPGGHDGEQLYVGRAHHEGELVPGKIVPSHGVCYIPWGGAEHGKQEYQVLVGCNPIWAPAIGGQVPPDALPAGEAGGEPLFVGRANHEGTLTLGKVHPSHNVCYIPYGGQEIAYQEYEVLVAK